MPSEFARSTVTAQDTSHASDYEHTYLASKDLQIDTGY